MKTTFEIDEMRFEANWRTVTYLIYNCALSLQIASQRTHALDPSEYLVFSVVACANLQRRMRELGPFSEDAIDHVPTDETNVPMSRRRIAEATGLPRETVRRIVQRLLDRGMLIQSGRYVLVPVGLIRGEGRGWEPSLVLGPVLSLMQALVGIGAVRSRTA